MRVSDGPLVVRPSLNLPSSRNMRELSSCMRPGHYTLDAQ